MFVHPRKVEKRYSRIYFTVLCSFATSLSTMALYQSCR